MKNNTIRTIAALAIGIGGPIIGYKLHKKAKKINEETQKSLDDAAVHIQMSYDQVMSLARKVDAMEPKTELADKLERMFGTVESEEAEDRD